MTDKKEQYTYFAFISYNTKDIQWGKKLQRKLENYRLPVSLCSEHNWESRTPIRPVFFAPTDIQPGDISEELKHRLESSLYLIVICSPNSANSKRVGQEIEYFNSLGRFNNNSLTYSYEETKRKSSKKDPNHILSDRQVR